MPSACNRADPSRHPHCRLPSLPERAPPLRGLRAALQGKQLVPRGKAPAALPPAEVQLGPGEQLAQAYSLQAL